jgi:hypothetical protein
LPEEFVTVSFVFVPGERKVSVCNGLVVNFISTDSRISLFSARLYSVVIETQQKPFLERGSNFQWRSDFPILATQIDKIIFELIR